MKKFLVGIVTIFFLVGCAKNPYTNRQQLILVSPAQEMQMGLSAEKEILHTQKLSKNRKFIQMLRRVASRIAKAADENFHPGYHWEFYVLDSPKINAFCLPGGKIFVYSGLMRLVENDDQLAAVVGHEVAHAILRHGSERVSMAMLGNLGKELLAKGLQVNSSKWGPLFNLAYGLGTQYGIYYPFSRKFEYEADQLGLFLMYKACYDPDEAILFWQKMMQISKVHIPEFLSTHPSDTHRLQALGRYIQELRTIPRGCEG